MNKVFLILSIASIALFACGGEYPCSHASPKIGFISFPATETDTIVVMRYPKGAGFSTAVDTFSFNSHNSTFVVSNDTLELFPSFGLEIGFESKYDYRVFLPGNSREYRITDINEEFRSMHGGGIFSMDKQGCFNLIRSYKLNGQLVQGAPNYWTFYITR